MEKNSKLTSVHILENVYRNFKITTIDGNMNLQKVVNRTLELYVKDESFRNTINNYNNLATTGSKY
jgi:hypothetical protein